MAKKIVCATELRLILQLFEGTSPRALLFYLSAECSSPAATALRRRSYGQVTNSSKVHRRVLCSSAHLPSAFLLMRRRRIAAGNGFSTGLSTTIKYLQRTRNGAAGNSLGTTIKYL
jgi:hypothetical protein